jgi:hypothetical protein
MATPFGRNAMSETPGKVVLFGSGETSARGRQAFDWLFRRLPSPVRVSILETPAGFELNSPQVAGRIGEFLSAHLLNYQPAVTLVPARKRATPFSPDDPDLAALLPGSHAIFLGPGSPTYAVRQLRGSVVWQTALACHRGGSALVLASAAVVAVSAYALPIYEIYKVGEDPFWYPGLDLFGLFGLPLVLIPHWNNQDGGPGLDTSRCYIGQARLAPLLETLPPGMTVVGIDEETALILDLADGTCLVLGRGGVSILRQGQERRHERGQSFSLQELGPFHLPSSPIEMPAEVLARLPEAPDPSASSRQPPADVLALVDQRESARARKDWSTADRLRREIADRGWQVLDTPQGVRLESR